MTVLGDGGGAYQNHVTTVTSEMQSIVGLMLWSLVMGQVSQQIWMGHVGHGSVFVTHWPIPINQWLSQSNFKNDFNNFWYYTDKVCYLYRHKFGDICTS